MTNNQYNGTPPTNPTFKILWGALLASQAILLFLLNGNPEVQGLEVSTAFTTEDPQVRIFYLISIVVLMASIFVPKFIYKTAKGKKTLQVLFVPFILRLALNESIALFGYLAAIGTSSLAIAYPFFIVSLIRHVRLFPSAQKIKIWLESESF